MVNGQLSRLIYVGAFVVLGIVIVTMAVLAIEGTDTPIEIRAALPTLLAFLLGSQITPPNIIKRSDGRMVEPGAEYVPKRDLE